eukprot:TRINITY_DN29531_c0_g1_i1.p1 TRINITY_DN29531_c0_g1~~TRINITY_DN29531_c0_g1_i1.p1  ORF type:complete len:206 (+),score=64.72 TRINITY_DN29531_c0_g1_i1:81-698(+)
MAAERLDMKIVMVGDIGVGKSCIAVRFIQNIFPLDMKSTLGASFLRKESIVAGRTVRFSVWDTAGQEAYHSLVPMYFRQAAAVILVYDLTMPKSLDGARRWHRQVLSDAPEGVIVALAGNKSDLREQRAVPAEEAARAAAEVGAQLHVECSAKEGDGVFELFESIAHRFVAQQPEDPGAAAGCSASGRRLDEGRRPAQRGSMCCY